MTTEYVYLDGEFVDAKTASIPVRNHAFLYGTSVFEGIRAYYNKEEDQLYAFRMKEHFERLINSCKIMHMDPKFSVEEFCGLTKELLKKVYIRGLTFQLSWSYERMQGIGFLHKTSGV